MRAADKRSEDAGELVGAPVIAIWYKTLAWAVDELAGLGHDGLKSLKVRAGEHLAAILTTAFFGAPPIRVDTDGGPDLLFSAATLKSPPFSVSPGSTLVVFEIKSLPGRFREFDSEIDRIQRRGGSAQGMSVSVRMQSVREIVDGALPLLSRAQESLVSKLAGSAHVSRNLFLVVHPFDAWAVELKHPVIGPFLPDLDCLREIDSVWVLLAPDRLAVWSARDRGWIDLIFGAMNEDEIPNEDLLPLQDAESRFLDLRGERGGSPYLFGIRSG